MLLNDTLTEQLVLGLMLSSAEACVRGVSELSEDYFDHPDYRIIFSVISELVETKKDVNLYSVKASLSAINSGFSLEDLVTINDEFYFPEKFDSLVETLTDRLNRRKTLEELKKASNLLKTDPREYQVLVKDFNITSGIKTQDKKKVTGTNYIESRRKTLEERKYVKPVLCGIPVIDDAITYKLNAKELSVIAARPSNGKSTLKANFIINQCQAGVGVASFALEQSLEVEADRIDSILVDCPVGEIAQAHLWPAVHPYKAKLEKAWEEQSKWNLTTIDAMGMNLNQIGKELRALSADGVKVAYFDLVDRITDISTSHVNKPQRVTTALTKLLEYAFEFEMHLCLLVQMNRETAKKKDPRPALHELKESGGYEEIARLVMLLHYPKFYDHSIVNSALEVRIAKQSNGPLAELELQFNKDSLKLTGREIKALEFKNMNLKGDKNA